MTRFYFDFCEDEHLSKDEIGMFLPDLNAAKEEAIRTLSDVAVTAEVDTEIPECSIRINDAEGRPLLTVCMGAGGISIDRDNSSCTMH